MRILTITLLLLLVCLCALPNSLALSPSFSCCMKAIAPRKTSIGPIKACYEQHPRSGCRHHAFQIITDSDEKKCLNPNLPWLKKEINEGRLRCPPDFSGQNMHSVQSHRFEVLDEDDLE